MHRLPSYSSVLRFRVASILLLLAALGLPTGLGFLAAGMLNDVRSEVFLGIYVLAGALVVFLIQLFVASRARCPLCTIPPLLKKGCQKNRRAKRCFGSYRLRVACGVVFQGAFNCPYCGEPTKLMVRERATGGIDSRDGGTESSGLR